MCTCNNEARCALTWLQSMFPLAVLLTMIGKLDFMLGTRHRPVAAEHTARTPVTMWERPLQQSSN